MRIEEVVVAGDVRINENATVVPHTGRRPMKTETFPKR